MRVILTGFMGAGKTTVGRLLARHLGWAFLDLDELVTLAAGRSIPDLFAAEGEAGFRAREAEALATALALERVVIATGGGTVLAPANRERLAREPWVFWLTAPVAELARRLEGDAGRPLLATPGAGDGAAAGHGPEETRGRRLAERIASLLAAREAAYAAVARYRIPTEGRDPARVAADILALLPGTVLPGNGRVAGGAARGDAPPAPPSPPQDTGLVVTAGSHRYPVWVRPGALGDLAGLLAASGEAGLGPAGGDPGGRAPVALVVADPVVAALYGSTVRQALAEAGFRVHQAIVPPGEEAKSLGWAQYLYDRLLDAGAGRDAWVWALGGGVVGDLAGFVAATYMRGLAFAQLPTTLLAQVDASVGGKVAVNHPRAKNLIGAFHHPRLVVADPRSLLTLPGRTYRCGLAEMVKHALLDSPAAVAELEGALAALRARDPGVLAPLIAASIGVKARYVALDPDERGPRAHLNLGHTFAHALEAATGYRVPHGEAVAAGLCLATALSARLGLCDPALARRVEELIGQLDLPTTLAEAAGRSEVAPPPAAALLDRLQHDKKKRGGRVRFVLIRAPGRVEVRGDVPPELVAELVERSLAGRPAL